MKKILCIILLSMATASYAETLKPRVFVSIPPQKQFIKRIAGDYVEVDVMLLPGESPETYSPTPRLIVSLSNAVSYFQIGVPFEKKWIDAIRSINKNIRIVPCCENILKVNQQRHEDVNDMHIWNNPVYVQQLARLMLDELIVIDPTHTNEFLNNYQNFITELVDLDNSIKSKLKNRKTKYFIVSHSAWGEYAQHYGLEQVALEKNGKEIGARSLLSIINIARQEGLNTLFVNEQYKTPFIDNLAAELGAKVISLDPLAEDYIENMSAVTIKIANSLGLQ
ncbi:MAG: zinc transport system substrate-binding protein [Gammaproteobacteria bacterium]|jgi:zinc transport system substrate-binding protein